MNSRDRQIGTSSMAYLLLAVIVVGTLVMCSKGTAKKDVQPPNYAAAARSACSQFVQRLSRNPTSYESIEQWNWVTIENADGTWSVLAHYRGQNGFGGMNVEKTTCVMSHVGDNWTLVSSARMK